jgi:glycosyltransferase involved in cell wall biosynthesis
MADQVDLPALTYLSIDSLAEGVGASQIVPYVVKLARRGIDVTLHTFEKVGPRKATAARLREADVRWHPHPFGRFGQFGGLGRALRGVPFARGAELLHARGDLPAAAAILSGHSHWVWDVRGLWADERIAAGSLKHGSVQEHVLRKIERAAARRSGGIVTLSDKGLGTLVERHGSLVRAKSRVITTCVDLGLFRVAAMPDIDRVSLLISGSLSARYDVPLMIRLAEVMRRRVPCDLVAFVPGTSVWDPELGAAGVFPRSALPEEMPEHTAAAHAGLAMFGADPGGSLRASMPTKIGELLACGRPVVVTEGVGDMDGLLADHDCGVVLQRPGVAGSDFLTGARMDAVLDAACDDLLRILEDPRTPARCRALAEEHFDLEAGVDALVGLYRNVFSGGS